MTYKKYILVFLFLTTAFFSCGTITEQNPYIYNASNTTSHIIIDGILDEAAWLYCEKGVLKINATADSVTDNTLKTWFKTCYDDTNLYIAFECNDSDIWSEFTHRDDHLWENDVVEIFIDSDGNRNTYYEIQVSPANVLFDAHLEIPSKTDDDEVIAFDIKGIETAVAIDGTLNMHQDRDRKWTVEMAIPVSDLNKEEAVIGSQNWHINYFRINKDKERETANLAWSPTASHFHIPSKFGQLQFH